MSNKPQMGAPDDTPLVWGLHDRIDELIEENKRLQERINYLLRIPVEDWEPEVIRWPKY